MEQELSVSEQHEINRINVNIMLAFCATTLALIAGFFIYMANKKG